MRLATAIVTISVLVAGCSAASDPTGRTTATHATPAASTEWTVRIEHLRLGASGIGLALHPTRAPVVIAADSGIPLRVCPADALGRAVDPSLSSVGRRWTRCRALGARPVRLPATDGRSHVGIRIRPADGPGGVVRALRLRWGCTDRYFVTDPPGGPPAGVAPRCSRD